MDNFVILQQMVAIDRAQNRAELRSSIQTLLRIIGSYTKSERVYIDRKSTRLNSSHNRESRMPSSA